MGHRLMSKVSIKGNTSGTGNFTLAAPNSNTDRTFNLPDDSGDVVVADRSTGAYDFTEPPLAGGRSVLLSSNSSSSVSLALNTWRVPNTERPTLVTVTVKTATDGSSGGEVLFNVDKSGGQTPDYYLTFFTDTEPSSGFSIVETKTILVASGESYELSNTKDPWSANKIKELQEFTL